MCPSNSKAYQRKNYAKYWGTPSRIKYRSGLVKANRDRGTYGNGDGKDLDHRDANPRNFKKSNLRQISSTTNRRKGAAKANRKRWGV